MEKVDLYPSLNEVDFLKINKIFNKLVLFDDVFLRMQGMNIALIDQFITEFEYQLLDEYTENSKPPINTAMFVSAQSQMWIFSIYELLRTWKERVNKYKKWKDNGGIEQILKNLSKQNQNISLGYRKKHLEKLKNEPEFYEKMIDHLSIMKNIFEMIEIIRINLAKHEIPKKRNSIVKTPGYARINMLCGALDFEVEYKNSQQYEFMNRRDIAEELRAIEVKYL